MFTKVDVVGILDVAIRKLLWIQKPTNNPLTIVDRFNVNAIGTGYLITLDVEDGDEPGLFIIRNSCDNDVKVSLQNEEDVIVCFNEFILPVMIHEYYRDAARNLLNAISKEIRASGKNIREERWAASVRGKECSHSLAFGDFKVMFTYEDDEKFSNLEYGLNGIVTKYNPVTLSEDFESIKETLISKTKQYIESIN